MDFLSTHPKVRSANIHTGKNVNDFNLGTLNETKISEIEKLSFLDKKPSRVIFFIALCDRIVSSYFPA